MANSNISGHREPPGFTVGQAVSGFNDNAVLINHSKFTYQIECNKRVGEFLPNYYWQHINIDKPKNPVDVT